MLPLRLCVSHAFVNRPGTLVSGDFGDVVRVDDDRTGFFVGDVMGKGAPAGLIMAVLQTTLVRGLHDGVGLVSLCADVNENLCQRWPGVIASLWMGVADAAHGTLRYVDAGHGLAFHSDGEGCVAALRDGGGVMLGCGLSSVYEEAPTRLSKGDRIWIVTDGVVEQSDPRGENFGEARVVDHCGRASRREDAGAALLQAVLAHGSGGLVRDDITILDMWCRGLA